jgi:hypothetical protein
MTLNLTPRLRGIVKPLLGTEVNRFDSDDNSNLHA